LPFNAVDPFLVGFDQRPVAGELVGSVADCDGFDAEDETDEARGLTLYLAAESSDRHLTPYWWLDEQIKKALPGCYLYDVVQ
jgi:hypothetical protein